MASVATPAKGTAASARRPVEILTQKEANALIRVCSNRAPTGIRNRALLTTLYRAGLRISEALALYPKDLDLQKGTVRVLHGKGDKARTVALDPAACDVVQRWLDTRAKRKLNGKRRLFCTLDGKPVKDAYVRALMKRLAQRAGVEKRVHAHGLRHTFAVELVREGFSMPFIQRLLGHSSLATTQRYLDHIAPEELIAAIRGRSWQVDD